MTENLFMAFDMLEAMTLIAREKNIDFDSVVETLEASLLAAAKKKYAYTDNISFKFDRKANELYMIASKKVVNQINDPNTEIALADAKGYDPDAELGDDLEIYLDYEAEFGRNAINSAKQILIQKIREAEHERIYAEYIDKVGQLVTGVVQQIDKGNVIVNLGRGEGILRIKEQIPREKFRQGDRIRAYIQDVQKTPRGPEIVLSRVNNEFLKALFALEVPEIYEKVIEIKAIAREPGERAKIAVWSSDERIDPVGACVGIKGVRVQSIVRELNNERIDIVPYTSNPELFVTRALAPAKVVHIEVFDIEKKMTVAVEDEKLSLAIGRNGQNARLASKLTGWKVNIMSETDYEEARKREAELLVPVGDLEGVGSKIRDRLVAADISSVQRLAASTIETLVKIDGIGEKTAETLIERAKEFVAQLEEERELREKAEAAARKSQEEDKKLGVSDVFHDDVEPIEESQPESAESTEEDAKPE
ncbi:transcription termination/antitermination protein NusA [candidate division GN15 bacterium]|uniref:Transcription termination/antitermination protein NusA n=1 Tax=candidate division GN15 bacterium TaxID=2072418 RepID=A0A855XCM6_9BACT|nr:MAG: transcription termination/antitermination protein NusA [candidate division GN15 bacterium]